jgi:RND family efflux transporter MFP subunit
VTKLQVEANKYALEKAQKDVDSATTELVCLEKYTHQKRTRDLEAAIKTTKANFDSAMQTHEVNVQKLQSIKDQLVHCTIKAPQAGQVVYANKVGMQMMGAEVIIEAGAVVRENQVVIRLPDPKQMQVKVMVDEANVGLVEVGQPAAMRMDAFPDLQLKGRVTRVSDYAAPSSGPSFMASFRQYETRVMIDDPPPELRPGLTAEVRIRVATINDVLLVPAHVVIVHGDKHYCLLEEGGRWEAREVEVGPTNAKFVVILKGLEEGQPVVMGAARYLSKVALPALPEKEAQGGKEAAGEGAAKANEEKGVADAKKAEEGPPTGNRPGPGGGPAGPNRGGPGGFDPAAIFQRLDADGDGKLSAGEIPAQMQSRTPSLDANGDGAIDREEWTAGMRQRPSRRGGQGGDGRGAPEGGPGGDPGGPRPGMGRPSG